MKNIRIFDIDGTITYPGVDLWYMISKSLSSDIELFDKFVSIWRDQIKAGENAYYASKSMMIKSLNLLPSKITGNDVRKKTKRISSNLIEDRNYFKGAIQHINNSIDKGFCVIISTANYYEAALGFLDSLVEHNIIIKNNFILVSGSRIDWKNKKIIHFNMGECKIKDISKSLNLAKCDLIERIESYYGDDPAWGDSALLKLPIKGFVIKNDKNKNFPLPRNISLTNWYEIIRYYDTSYE